MAQDHRYVRELLRLREAPQLPVLWLLVPWIAATAWSCDIARLLWQIERPVGLTGGLVVALTVLQFLEIGGIGIILSWAWLYVAWPEHLRVLCWSALAGMIALWVGPWSLKPVAPIIVSLCMVAAVIEQAVARRRSRARAATTAPAV